MYNLVQEDRASAKSEEMKFAFLALRRRSQAAGAITDGNTEQKQGVGNALDGIEAAPVEAAWDLGGSLLWLGGRVPIVNLQATNCIKFININGLFTTIPVAFITMQCLIRKHVWSKSTRKVHNIGEKQT